VESLLNGKATLWKDPSIERLLYENLLQYERLYYGKATLWKGYYMERLLNGKAFGKATNV